jgi:predicted Fe-S protein YdhL (DUF1289 family)
MIVGPVRACAADHNLTCTGNASTEQELMEGVMVTDGQHNSVAVEDPEREATLDALNDRSLSTDTRLDHMVRLITSQQGYLRVHREHLNRRMKTLNGNVAKTTTKFRIIDKLKEAVWGRWDPRCHQSRIDALESRMRELEQKVSK